MFTHHLKMAFRNLRKYKTQNIISIIGLAVGFTCFAFSALWIRYEMSFDNFHPKADRIYRVQIDRFKWTSLEASSEISEWTGYLLANWLKSTYPEIEDACGIQIRPLGKFSVLYTNYSFCNIFDMNIPEDFFIQGRTDRPVALTDNHKGATEFIKEEYNYDVQMTIPRWQANTNFKFDLLAPITTIYDEQILNNWGYRMVHTYILIREMVNVEVLKKKLDKVEDPDRQDLNLSPSVTLSQSPPLSFVLTPLRQLRYNDPSGNMLSDIKFSHIQIFAIAGLLVILCSLFNHLTLYVTCIRMRLREIALRKVNGASDWQIAATLYTDFLLVIVLSLVLGFMLMAWLLPTFKEYATIGHNNINIFAELALYAALLIVCGFFAGGIPILYFRKQDLNESIKGAGKPGSGNLFRKASLLVQLIISLGLIFCSAVFIKQIRYLHHTDLGIDRHNIAAVTANPECCMLTPPYAARIKQVPGVIDALPVTDSYFLMDMTSGSVIRSFVNDNGESITLTFLSIYADAHFFDFFGIKFIEGNGFVNEDIREVYNETAAKELGENNSLRLNAAGVVYDFYLDPTTKARPTYIWYPFQGTYQISFFQGIAYRHEEGMRQQTQQAITKWLREEFPNDGEFEIYFTYMEDIFEEHFKSERALFTLLSVMTLACILIAIFGVYSLTSLTCQQRKKEIAIRKVHGAEVVDIMNIFFKEYLILLGMAALVAFPAGYLIMKRWLEGYVKQTSMDAWLYVAIFLAVFVVIVFSIVSMVWKAANQNPAEVVKSE